jgi:hypothetical protein
MRSILLVVLGMALLSDLLLDLIHGDVSDGGVAIEDAGDFLKGRSLGLRINKVHPNEFDEDPALEKC